jgi:hypothetical protein
MTTISRRTLRRSASSSMAFRGRGEGGRVERALRACRQPLAGAGLDRLFGDELGEPHPAGPRALDEPEQHVLRKHAPATAVTINSRRVLSIGVQTTLGWCPR